MGQAFARELKKNPELKDAYTRVGKSYEMQKIFKMNWSKEKFTALTTVKKFSASCSEEEGTHGDYAPLSEIAWRKKSRVAAINYMNEAIRRHKLGTTYRGRPWVLKNTFTKSWEFLYLSTSFASKAKNEWRIEEKGVKRQRCEDDSHPEGAAPAAKAAKIEDQAQLVFRGKGLISEHRFLLDCAGYKFLHFLQKKY